MKVLDLFADIVKTYLFNVIAFLIILLVFIRVSYCVYNGGYNQQGMIRVVDPDNDER